MRRTLPQIAGAVWLLAWMAAAPATADPITPASLVPALTVYVDSLARGHAGAATCAPPESPARDEAGWSEAKAVLIASLWANGYPPDFVADVGRRLDAPPPATKPDCAEETVMADFGAAVQEGWVKEVGRVIGALDLRAVEQPVAPARWAEIRKIIAGEISMQAREFTCLAAVEPGVLPVIVHGWDEMIVKLGGDLVAAGIPRPEIVAALGSAEANALWKPAGPDELAVLRKSCMDDTTWSDRLTSLRDLGLGYAVAKMLPAASR
jgi:hypothetical protein